MHLLSTQFFDVVKKGNIFKVISVNLILLFIVLLGMDFLARIVVLAKIDFFKPIKSIQRLGRTFLFNRGNHWQHLKASNILRKPYPYLMFKGAPNVLDHNDLGYRINDPITEQTINIAFFGGSTGYNGTPPIINQITEKLNSLENQVTKYAPLNFSVVASNHNQHIHSLVENYNRYPIDIILFYGGYNETIQTAKFNAKPGYPYSFHVRNEMSPEEMLLMKHSFIYQNIKLKLSNFSEIKPFQKKWNNSIVNNYVKTINTARLLSNSLTTGRCKIPFVFAYQPYQMSENHRVPSSFKEQVHSKIQNFLSVSSDGIDLSNSFLKDKQVYTDIVHLTQEGREVIAQNILQSMIFKNAIRSCNL